MMEEIKKLREQTGAGVMDAKRALEEAGGDMEKAEKIIIEKGLAKAEKRSEREVGCGKVFAYTHATGKVGAMVEIAVETDFVADTEEFSNLCKEVAMQVASMEPANVDELLEQDYIRDGSKKIKDLVTELIGKTGENTKIVRFMRFELGR
jgi:elongation factor Ts